MINTQIRLAILGFGSKCSKKNAQIASTVGNLAGRNAINLIAGNVSSTFGYAFINAKKFNVSNICVIEKHKKPVENHHATEIYLTEDSFSKHAQIAQMADAGILIGGGPGSQLLLNHFLKNKKTVVAIEGTGGIADKNISEKIIKLKNPTDAFKFLLDTKRESFISSSLGNIKLTYNHFALTKLEFIDQFTEEQKTKEKHAFVKQILKYIQGKPVDFTGRIHLTGTDFQKSVWRAMLDIPYGKTMDFVEFSKFIGKDKSEGAIANAAIQNPIPIIIPSHRLITKRGLFHGDKELQSRLLDLEKRQTELGIF